MMDDNQMTLIRGENDQLKDMVAALTTAGPVHMPKDRGAEIKALSGKILDLEGKLDGMAKKQLTSTEATHLFTDLFKKYFFAGIEPVNIRLHGIEEAAEKRLAKTLGDVNREQQQLRNVVSQNVESAEDYLLAMTKTFCLGD